jgi:SAM-dependent MidA family methyltransferase
VSASAQPEFPPPPAEAEALSRQLRARIAAEIEANGGCIPFSRYMEMVLYEPGLGYYRAGSTKLGRAGDFITAPEISTLFGRCIARQIAQVLGALGGGCVLEFGAGSGRLAVDVLNELETHDALPERYFIMEVSGELRARQRSTLERAVPHLAVRVQWLDTLPPQAMIGVMLANEVLDAMPVARVRKRAAGGWCELCVACDQEAFAWQEGPVISSGPLALQLDAIESQCGGELPAGYTTEINLHLMPWFRTLSDSLERGAVVVIDYGYSRREYYHPERRDGTLLCHYRHRVHDDPFLLVGLQDITASVDFSAAAEAADAAGFEVAGYTTQAQFLLALGLTDVLTSAAEAEPAHWLALAQQAKQLTIPSEMGERFKVLAVTKNFVQPLRGFALANQLQRL